jgi:hypothetical protein
MHNLRPISVWPSILTRIGSNQSPHIFGGSLIASRLGYLTRDDTSILHGSIEFNSVRVTGSFHIVNAYFPILDNDTRKGSGSQFDDAPFLDHISHLISRPGSSTLIVGDFNVDLRRFPNDSRRGHTVHKLLELGFAILNPVDSDGQYLDTHYSASSRHGSCIDVVLWRGPLRNYSLVNDVRVTRLLLNSRDHYGLRVTVSGLLPTCRRRNPPPSAFIAFAKCLGSAPPSSSSDATHLPEERARVMARDLWARVQNDMVPFSEACVSDLVALWLKRTRKQSDPLYAEYFSACSNLVRTRESLRLTHSLRLFRTLCLSLRFAHNVQRSFRSKIKLRNQEELSSSALNVSIMSGSASHIRRFLLNTLNAPGGHLDLSSLTVQDFERFRVFYSECLDPPDSPPPDLSFLESSANSVPFIPNAVAWDISHVCNEEELLLAINALHSGKAPGPSLLPVDFYKIAYTQPEVIKFLLHTVNECLSGNRPSYLDECKLILLYKKGCRSDPSNWRPINLTNAAFRVCESVIHRRLLRWSEQVLGPHAFGFRPGRRAEDICYLLANKLHRANRDRRPTHLLSLDISKAFDTVRHDHLLLSLARAGLSIFSVKVIACILLGHRCIVGDPSSPRQFVVNVRRGVLQGGILSPLLFNVFFDQSLPTSVPDILPLAYADDVSAIHVGPAPSREPSDLSVKHHHALLQQRSAVRAHLCKELAGPSSNSDSAEPLFNIDNPPYSSLSRILSCRAQVNSWLCERDSWLSSNHMRHNASKSEAYVLHCPSVGIPPLQLSSGAISVRDYVTVLGMQPQSSGYCDRPGARLAGARVSALFSKAWQKLRRHVTLQELRSLLMAFIYSHSVFGSCLQRFTSHCLVSPMTRCIRAALRAHPSVNSASLYEFMGLILPSMRVVLLRLGFLMRCMDPTSPQLLRDEFRFHRLKSPWFAACLSSLSKLPQPKSGLSLCDRLSNCISVISQPAVELPATFSHPLPDALNAVLVTDGSTVTDEHSLAGPSGWGYLLFHNGLTYSACGPLGTSTPDNAEATALLHGLLHCQRLGAAYIHVRTDSLCCKDLLDGTAFPESLGCLRLYLSLPLIDSQIFPFKVFSHSAPPHRDILNDLADDLAKRGCAGTTLLDTSTTLLEHLVFLQKPIPRYNPGRDGGVFPPLSESSHTNALTSFRRAVQASVCASQIMQHLDIIKCNFRWTNFPGSPPAIVKAPIMNQQYLYHLRYDLHSHFSRHSSLSRLQTPCPFCGSADNSGVHRIFECTISSSVISTPDVISFGSSRRDLRAYRSCYTSLLPLDVVCSEYPRSDQDYLFWLGSSQLLIVDPDASVRVLTEHEMGSLARASHSLHLLYVKYSVMALPPVDLSAPCAPSRAPNSRTPSASDISLMCSRLNQCRLYNEIVGWYQWHGYAYSTTNALLHRAGYTGFPPMSLLELYMRLEVLLSACLCAYPSARSAIMSQHSKPGAVPRLTRKVYNLLREGNPLSVPVTKNSLASERPVTRHLDVPDFFYSLPFHYYNSSVLVEAWFAAPSTAERRRLIDWPPFADADGKFSCPIWKLFAFEEIPKALYTRPGSGDKKGSRSSLHPHIDMLYEILKKAVRCGHIRIKWRPRFQLLLTTATESTALLLRRQLLLSLILGDVRDVPDYKPRDAVFGHSYLFTSTVMEVSCVPICFQNIVVSHVPGLSLPARGPRPHPPRFSFYLGVKQQIDDYNQALLLASVTSDPDSPVCSTAMSRAATALAHSPPDADGACHDTTAPPAPSIVSNRAIEAMILSATTWARELIDSSRDPSGPDCHTFPTLELPPLVPSLDAPDLPARSAQCLSDDDDDPALYPFLDDD